MKDCRLRGARRDFAQQRYRLLNFGKCLLALKRRLVFEHLGRHKRVRVGQIAPNVEADYAFQRWARGDYILESSDEGFALSWLALHLETNNALAGARLSNRHCCSWFEWRRHLVELIATCSLADTAAMGFPQNWQTLPAWR